MPHHDVDASALAASISARREHHHQSWLTARTASIETARRPASTAVATAATINAIINPRDQPLRRAEVHRPAERLRIDHFDQHDGITSPVTKPDCYSERCQQRAFECEHLKYLPPRHADMAQHAELARAGDRLRGEGRRDSDQANRR